MENIDEEIVNESKCINIILSTNINTLNYISKYII